MGIRIYGFRRSIATFRVRVALRLKGLPFEEIPVDILSGEQFDPAYEAINSERVVPTFVHDGNILSQSLAIIEYLEDVQPEPPLLPAPASERAYVRSLALATVADSHPLITPRVCSNLASAFGADAAEIENWSRHWTGEGLATFERILERRRPAPFVLGVVPGLADICIAGHILGAEYFKLELDAFPMVAELGRHCFALSSFAASHPSAMGGGTGQAGR